MPSELAPQILAGGRQPEHGLLLGGGWGLLHAGSSGIVETTREKRPLELRESVHRGPLQRCSSREYQQDRRENIGLVHLCFGNMDDIADAAMQEYRAKIDSRLSNADIGGLASGRILRSFVDRI